MTTPEELVQRLDTYAKVLYQHGWNPNNNAIVTVAAILVLAEIVKEKSQS